MNGFKKDFSKSVLFYENNKEYILDKFTGNNNMFSIEIDSNVLAKLFDMYAGIDYILVNKDFSKMYGIAARVNFAQCTKGNITIRYSRRNGIPTEYSKRVDSILNNDSFYPHITIQIDSNNFNKAIGGIFLKTRELYLYIEENKEYITNAFMKTCYEGNKYLSIPYPIIKDVFKIPCKVF